MRKRRKWKVLAAVCLAAVMAFAGIGRTQQPTTDLALVFAIDCSFSVDSSEYRLQMQGLGQALQDPEVWEAIQHGPNRRIAVAAFLWSGNTTQATIVPWTMIDSEQAAARLGATIEALPRSVQEGGTSISSAMLYTEALFEAAPPALRRVVDVSTDGRNNVGPPLSLARARLVSKDISINALAITNEFPKLDVYAETHIIAGASSFAVKANSYDDYGAAILRKLIREITGAGTV